MVFMALTCVNNHPGEHADTTEDACYLRYSEQQHKVPRICVYRVSKRD